MKRVTFRFIQHLLLQLLLWFFVYPTIASPDENSRERAPNIVFIMSDDHATKAISAYGSPYISTPNIDSLAQEGIRFTQAFCTNSICGPARAAILTGKYSHKNGYIVNETTRFDNTQTTFPKLFQAAGYQTALIGKWHLGSDPTGFDFWDILIGQGRYVDPEFNCMGTQYQEQGYVTDIVSKKTTEWIRRRDPDRPFLLLTQHKAPHSNFTPSPKYSEFFRDSHFPAPNSLFEDGEGKSKATRDNNMRLDPHLQLQFVGDPGYQPPEELTGRERTEWIYQWYMRRYMGCVKSVDDAVGDILQVLEEQGIADNTVVIYTSDQGFFLGEHGWYDKRLMYEESLQIPVLMRYPSIIKGGIVEDRMIANIDFAETLLDLAHIPIPEDMQGVSLLPLLRGERTPEWREATYYHYYEYPGWHYVKRHYGIRTQRYKLIHYYHDTDEWELYDLVEDPEEMHNRYDDPAYSEVISALELSTCPTPATGWRFSGARP